MTDPIFKSEAGRWLVGGASATGPSHLRRGIVNQDAYLFQPDEGEGPVILAAIADGHGAPAHYRSDRGARFAVRTAIDALDWLLQDREAINPDELSSQIIEGWQSAVQQDVAVDPLDQGAEQPLLPYGSTLLGAAATSESVCLTQLGDGDILLGYPDGRIERPMAEDESLVGEQTYSLCLPDATSRINTWFAHRNWDDEIPDFILMATDGVSKSFRTEEAFRQVAADYRLRCQSSPENFAKITNALSDWLRTLSTRGAGDDATMILAVRIAEPNGGVSHD